MNKSLPYLCYRYKRICKLYQQLHISVFNWTHLHWFSIQTNGKTYSWSKILAKERVRYKTQKKKGRLVKSFETDLIQFPTNFFFILILGDRMELCFGFSGILHSIEVCLKFPAYSKKFLTNLYSFIQGSLEWPFSEFSVMHCYGTYTNLLLLTLSCPEF